MRAVIAPIGLLVLALIVITSGSGQEPPAPGAAPKGDVEILIRKPDGEPAANVEVHIESAEPAAPYSRKSEVAGKTDDKGLIRVTRPAGVGQVSVHVSGVGYGDTGLFEAVPGRVVRAPLAPLAPFATLEGTVPEKLRGLKTQVRLQSGTFTPRILTVPTNVAGQFRTELPAGRWSVYTIPGDAPGELVALDVVALPGQRIDRLPELSPPDAQPGASLRPPPDRPQPARGTTVVWATGTVRDEAGKPVAGATVWALAVYHGGIRMYEQVKKTKTDADGKYELKGDGGLASSPAAIVAHAAGKPPAWAWDRQIGSTTVDFVLPDRGGRLDVTVERDGKPAAGVKVGVWLEGVELRDVWAAGDTTPERAELEAVIHPVATTDDAGVARFEHLLPGRYQVIGAEGDERRVRSLQMSWHVQTPEPFGIAVGVPVVTGRTTAHRLTIYKRPHDARVRVLKPDGTPLTGEGVPFDFSAMSGGGWASSRKLDADGTADLTFNAAGLWRVSFKYRGTPITTIPVRGAPYTAAEGVVAVSALLPVDKTPTTRLTARRFDPGVVVVELRDAAGKPARGVVELMYGNGLQEPGLVGSTDEAGVVRFEGVPEQPCDVKGYIAGGSFIALGSGGAPVPEERLLRGRTAVLTERIVSSANTERRVVLREQKVGYVLCRVRPPQGRATSDYYVSVVGNPFVEGARSRYRLGTGEFVAGPFAPGKVRLSVWGATKCEPKDVTIEAGEVTRVEMVPTAEALPSPSAPGAVLLGAGGLSAQEPGADRLSGRVLLPGGKEPASGAVVAFFGPEGIRPTLVGLTDATGRIRGKGLWYFRGSGDHAPDDPPGPLVVAQLPGTHGAVILKPTPGKPLEIVLPPARALRGRVTVGGAAPVGVPGSIQILAAYEGQGRLNGVLSVRTTAQADGTFELGGLTTGRYTIQAALDDIWLSPAATVEVADKPLTDLKLAIPAPGGAVVVTVLDADGKPQVGRAVTIDRPSGPLTAQLWPPVWATDGAGTVHVPTLEAGRHTVRVTDTDVSAEVVVSPLAEARTAEVQLRLARPKER